MLPTESVIGHHHEMKIASLFTTAHSLFICVSVFSCVCACVTLLRSGNIKLNHFGDILNSDRYLHYVHLVGKVDL